jgi:hypothetical protein
VAPAPQPLTPFHAARRSTFATVCASHRPPRAVGIPPAFKAAAISRNDFAPAACASRMAGVTVVANVSALACERALTAARASARRGFPRRAPRALAACNAALVRSLMILRSRSARAAHRCRVKVSASAPSSATMKGLSSRVPFHRQSRRTAALGGNLPFVLRNWPNRCCA